MNPVFDIAIIGGGLVGASLAVALSGKGYRIAMVEAVSRSAATQPSYDDRTLALAATSRNILTAINAWPADDQGITPIRCVLASDHGHPGALTISNELLGLPALGYVVEARRLGKALTARLATLDDVTQFVPYRLTDLSCDDTGADLTLRGEAGERHVRANLVIGADGARSKVAELHGIERAVTDYGQTAIIANITPAMSHDNRAFERFTATGPLAVLPHEGKRCGIVWTVPTDRAEAILALDDRAFATQLNHRFGYRLGAIRKVGKRASYPLMLVEPERKTAPQTLLIGNSAHTIHPVGAQGFNLGLRDVAALVEHLEATPKADWGSMKSLRCYQRSRDGDQQATIATTDGLVHWFAAQSHLVSGLRGAGMIAVDLLPPLKRELARRMMGLRDDVPRLARGVA